MDIKKLKQYVADKIAKAKESILDRETRRKIDKKARKRGLSQEQIDYEIDNVKNRENAEEIYEIIARSLLQLGFFLSPELEYKPQGIRTKIVIRALTYEEHQEYCKEAGVLYKKATPESLADHEKKEAEAKKETKENETIVLPTEEKPKIIVP